MCTLPDLFNRVRGTEDLGSSRAQEMEGLASGLPRWHHEYKGETEHPRGGSRKEESAVSEERAQPSFRLLSSRAPKRSFAIFAHILLAARYLATSWKRSLWALKKKERRGANSSTSKPASSAAST